MAIRRRTISGGWDGSIWVFVLLALLTLVPAACVLWFMNEALARESESSRRRVLDAYRGQLRLVRERLDPLWRAHAAGLDLEPGLLREARPTHSSSPRGQTQIDPPAGATTSCLLRRLHGRKR